MSQPEYFAFDEFKGRKIKLDEIRGLGINPYTHHFSPSHDVKSVCEQYKDKEVGTYEEAIDKKTDHVVLGGRIMLHRSMGKNIFAQIREETGNIQLMFNRDVISVHGLKKDAEITPHKFVEKKLDLGDIIGVEGHLFRTQKGELTVMVHEVTLLTKALLPLPDKHAGLKDKEIRYRKRYLDLISSPEVMETFIMRSKIISLIRSFFEKENFLEFETPVLERLYGGAQAKPFTTHLNALHLDMYMRIALELPLKKLIVGGFSRVFQIGKLFRNEGIDATHNPEFTSIEFYAAYWDYNDQMKFTVRLFEHIAEKLFGTTKIGVRKDRKGEEHEMDLKGPWPALTMNQSIKQFASIDVDKHTDDELRALLLEKSNLTEEKISAIKARGLIIQEMFEQLVEHHLIQPHFIIDHPIEDYAALQASPKSRVGEKGHCRKV